MEKLLIGCALLVSSLPAISASYGGAGGGGYGES